MANFLYDPDQPDGPHNDPGAPATIGESVAEYARNVGGENPDQEWILSPQDSWEHNPFYTGKPGRHPEDDSDDYDGPDPWEADRLQWQREANHSTQARVPDDEIPF